MTRKYFIDNIRWATVLLVLLYHVCYNFNAEGVFGALGGFSEVQYQDIILYLLNPWFMALLFLVAGISSRYALERRPPRDFLRSRTRKLLVPSTIGLFVFQWILGYFNTRASGAAGAIPAPLRYPMWAVSGIGPLWFIQELWLFSLLLLLFRRLLPGKKIAVFFRDIRPDECKDCSRTARCKRRGYCVGHQVVAGAALVVGGLLLLWGTAQSQIDGPTAAQGLLNLYRPLFYLPVFLLGYYVFALDDVQALLARWRWPLLVAALLAMAAFTVRFFGSDYTAPACLQSLWNNLFAWLMILAVLGGGKAWADRTTPFASYMTRSSFGIYVVHMAVCTGTGCLLKASALPVWSIYLCTFLATFLVSPLLYELLRRIPFVRWCVLGIKK